MMPIDSAGDAEASRGIFGECVVLYYISSLVVVCGVFFGLDFIPRQYYDFKAYAIVQPPKSTLWAFAHWDGVWYRDIAENGYEYNPDEGSYVIFFPGYPVLGHLVDRVTNVGSLLALLTVSHLSFFGCIWLLAIYLRRRFPDSRELIRWTLLIFVFSPISIFFRFAYAESLFCFLILLGLTGVQRRWPGWLIALIVGASTSVRLVGVAMLPVLLLYLVDESRGAGTARLARLRCLLPQLLLCIPLSVWGIVSFAVFLGVAFDEPLAFVRNHEQFNNAARMQTPFIQRALDLLTLEPIWSIYLSPSFLNGLANPLTELKFLNPLYFVATATTVVVGVRCRLINRYEATVAALLLLIPYLSKGYDNSMLGFARYSIVVVPAYWVAGSWAGNLPTTVSVPILVLSGSAMACFAALFAAWRIII